MIVYNVTLKVETSIAEQWKTWMQEEHIPEMLATGFFVKNAFYRLLEQDETEGITFVAQYFCSGVEDYQAYLQQCATAMRQKGIDKFGERVLGFRTLMEEIE